MDDFTLHINTFADRVRAMNQMRLQDLRLTPVEANNLLADITQLSIQVARSQAAADAAQEQTVSVEMNGGSF